MENNEEKRSRSYTVVEVGALIIKTGEKLKTEAAPTLQLPLKQNIISWEETFRVACGVLFGKLLCLSF